MVRFQKLTRNLFLTLHGQNVHRQQQQQQREFRARFRKDAWCVFSKPCTKLTLHCNQHFAHKHSVKAEIIRHRSGSPFLCIHNASDLVPCTSEILPFYIHKYIRVYVLVYVLSDC
jgi:hypothetical protein